VAIAPRAPLSRTFVATRPNKSKKTASITFVRRLRQNKFFVKICVYDYFSVYYCRETPKPVSFAVELLANLTGRQTLAVKIL